MIPIPTEAPTLVANAYRWMHRGDQSMAETQVRKLTAEELRAAHTDLLRLAVLIETVRFEDLAKAILTPDALPEGVEGTSIGTRNQQHAERALADKCPWCGADPCPERDVHDRLDAMSEGTWLRRARAT